MFRLSLRCLHFRFANDLLLGCFVTLLVFVIGNSPESIQIIITMKKILLFASVLAVLGLTACEKTLDVGEDNTSMGQVKNSVLQVRTRGASGDGATVAYPVAVYVFEGDECKGVQTIGDEGQTLNIALTEGTYSVYAVGGVSSSDYVLPRVSNALTTSAITLQEGKKCPTPLLRLITVPG